VILEEISLAAEEWRRKSEEAEAARLRLRALMREAARAGYPQRQIAQAAGVSLGRVGQILSPSRERR
jgi:hypothetical protein